MSVSYLSSKKDAYQVADAIQAVGRQTIAVQAGVWSRTDAEWLLEETVVRFGCAARCMM